MKAFLSEEKSLLIVTPYRCGSSYLSENVLKLNLIAFNLHTKKTIEIFKNFTENIENKVFLYRDPLERYLSLYHRFCFGLTPKNKENGAIYVSKKRSKDFWEEVYFTLPQLEKNFALDAHTATQYSYFTSTEEKIEDYSVFDMYSYEKFMFLYLSEKVPKHKTLLFDIPLNYKAIVYLNKIQETINKIYSEDYSEIKPHVMDL